MPYIKKEQRNFQVVPIPFDSKNQIIMGIPENAGELNYYITELCKLYVQTKGKSYQTYNDIVGVLECSKLELYRRKISSYEDQKARENGDVYSE